MIHLTKNGSTLQFQLSVIDYKFVYRNVNKFKNKKLKSENKKQTKYNI